MLSSSRRLVVPLFVYLSLLLATAVEAHDVPLHLRDHGNMKRLMKKRSPFPADSDPIIPTAVAGAAGIPTLSSTSASVTSASATESSTSSTSTSSSTSATQTSSSVTSSSTTGTVTSTTSSSTSTTSVTSTSSTQTSTSSTSTTAAAVTSASLNIAQAPAASTSTVVQANVTSTAYASAQTSDTVATTVSGATATSDTGKSTIATALIAVAASVGGVAILWTVFRKWKLSSSKKFDERLRPIDWQQPTADDDAIPTHRRNSGASSFRSGSGHGHGDPLDHDFTAGPASTVGGYADLARGPAAPPMTENLSRGPSFNRPFDTSVPLHHQGYGGARY